MADPAPLFVSSRTELLAKLRLSGYKDTGDTAALINQAITRARLEFYKRLAATSVTTLVGYTHSDNPSSTQEVMRAIAEDTEVLLVWYSVLQLLPVQAMDGDMLEQWNEAAPFRELSPSEVQQHLDRTMAAIDDNFARLEGEISVPDTESVKHRGATFEPTTTPYRPYDSVFQGYSQ